MGKFGACLHTLKIQKSLMHKFRTARLHSKIVLSKSDFRFAWVAILRNKIACIAREHHVIYLTMSSFRKFYHFADVSKMISNFFSCIDCRFFCLFNDGLEVSPLNVTHYRGKFTSTPTFNAIVLDGDRFKSVKQLLYFFCSHNIASCTTNLLHFSVTNCFDTYNFDICDESIVVGELLIRSSLVIATIGPLSHPRNHRHKRCSRV